MAAAEWSLVFDSDLKSSIFKSFFSLKGQHLQSCQIAIFFFENLFDPPDCSRARPNLTSSQLSAAAFEAEIFLHSACSTTDGRLHILIVVRDRGRGNNNTFPGPQKTFFYRVIENKWPTECFSDRVKNYSNHFTFLTKLVSNDVVFGIQIEFCGHRANKRVFVISYGR